MADRVAQSDHIQSKAGWKMPATVAPARCHLLYSMGA